MSTVKKTFIITGANTGLGLDATKQLALRDDVQKVYLACRSKAKAEKAISDLVATGISADKLEFIMFDGSSSKAEIEASAGVIPAGTVIDGIVLNAGGVGHDTVGKPTGPNQILPIVQINIAAHTHLINFLLKKGYLVKNKSRVVFSGTEGSRGISFMGMKSPEFTESTPEYFKTYMDGSAYKKYDGMGVAYSDAKGLGTFYMAAWARAHPEIFALTVSPGGTKGTSFAAQEGLPFIMKYMFPIIMSVFGLLGYFHELEVGAKRYVDAVTGEGEFEKFTSSGAYIASKTGISGPVVDQVEVFDTAKQYGDVTKQEAVYKALNEFL